MKTRQHLINVVHSDSNAKSVEEESMMVATKIENTSSKIQQTKEVEKQSSVQAKIQLSIDISNTNKERKGIYEIGKNITQEDIDNETTEEERQRLINERAYVLSLEESDATPLSDEEILKIIEKDLKKRKSTITKDET